MNTDECRKAFEAWAVSEGYSLDREPNEKGGSEYSDMFLNPALDAFEYLWNARTESKLVTREAGIDILMHALNMPDAGRRWAEVAFDRLALQLSAPQSPVVPISCSRCGDPVRVGVCENCVPDVSPVVPGVDLSELQRWDEYDFGLAKNHWGPWVKFEDVRHLLATGGRESREDRYRQALEMIVSKSRDRVGRGIVMAPSDAVDMVKLARQALATTQPNEGVV